MNQKLTLNENIKNFDDVSCEAEHLKAAKPKYLAYLVESSSHNAFRPRCKKSKINVTTKYIQKVSQ